MRKIHSLSASLAALFSLFFLIPCASCGAHSGLPGTPPGPSIEKAFTAPASPSAVPDRRPFDPFLDGKWIGSGIAYGPHRDGQTPGVKDPRSDEILEDLRIMSKHWNMIRVYAAEGSAGIMCQLIRQEKLPLRVMVGAWISPESQLVEGKSEPIPANIARNKAEVAAAIALANQYPEIVIAVGVGNETQVNWSAHRGDQAMLIGYIRQVRTAIKAPVTTCDDFSYWKLPESKPVADECDFIAVHVYAMWNKQLLSDAMNWSRTTLRDVQAAHPGVPLVITEIGWATNKGTEGYQAIGVVAAPHERDQELFYRALRDWATRAQQPYFFFEAFDEKWKGGNSPDEIEKHWGVFNSDRSPKLIFREEPGHAGK